MQPTRHCARLIRRAPRREEGVNGRSRHSRLRVGASAMGVLLAGSLVRAEIRINPQGWRFPNTYTSAKEMIRVSDRTPLIPGKETILKGYRKMDGTHFMTFEFEGRVFGVLVDTDGKPPFEYSIMDTDGDGKFESKFSSGPESKESG